VVLQIGFEGLNLEVVAGDALRSFLYLANMFSFLTPLIWLLLTDLQIRGKRQHHTEKVRVKSPLICSAREKSPKSLISN
jgi:hypothetical protein